MKNTNGKQLLFNLSIEASEKIDYYKKQIGVSKSAFLSSLIEKYADEYGEKVLKSISNYNAEK